MTIQFVLRPLVVVLVLVVLSGAGDVIGDTVDDNLTVRAGAIFFNRPQFDSVVLVEFPFTMVRGQFEFFRPDTGTGALFARIFAQIDLYGADGLAIDSANTYFSASVPDQTAAHQPDYSLFNSLALVISPGVYSARLTVIDVVSKREGQFFYDRIIVEPPEKERLAMGGKCLAHHIAYIGDAAPVGSGVPKNGYEVRCNPLGIFSTADTVAFLYAELYNLDFSPDRPSDYRVSFTLLDDAGQVARHLGTRERPKAGSSAVLVESFDIGGLPQGSYLLEIAATDGVADQEIRHEIPLRILAPVPFAEGRVRGSIFDPIGELDLQIELALVRYLLNPEEKMTLKGLSPVGQVTFILQYWQEHDSDRATEVIEDRAAMYLRYLYANNFFSQKEDRSDGWTTDRGRIYMLYGPWDRIDDMQHLTRGYPYQIWTYFTLKKGDVFVFQDDGNLGDFRLVHSNVTGELFSSTWDKALKTGIVVEE